MPFGIDELNGFFGGKTRLADDANPVFMLNYFNDIRRILSGANVGFFQRSTDVRAIQNGTVNHIWQIGVDAINRLSKHFIRQIHAFLLRSNVFELRFRAQLRRLCGLPIGGSLRQFGVSHYVVIGG